MHKDLFVTFCQLNQSIVRSKRGLKLAENDMFKSLEKIAKKH
jgi:hypothetical protein